MKCNQETTKKIKGKRGKKWSTSVFTTKINLKFLIEYFIVKFINKHNIRKTRKIRKKEALQINKNCCESGLNFMMIFCLHVSSHVRSDNRRNIKSCLLVVVVSEIKQKKLEKKI